MQASLKMFVVESYTPDKADLVIESFDILEDAQIEDYENGFFDILMQEADSERSDVPHDFESLVMRHLNQIVIDHDITVAQDTPLSYLNALCSGILGIQYYMAPDELSLVLESDKDSEEKFSSILELVVGLDYDRSLVHLESVSPSLLDMIETIVANKQMLDKSELNEESEQHYITKKLRDINRFLNSPELIAYKLVDAGVVVGVNFDQYIKYFVNHTEGLSVEQLAKEVFMLINLSRDGFSDMLGTFTKYSSSLFLNLDETTKVFTALNKLSNDFDRYMLQRNALIKNPIKAAP